MTPAGSKGTSRAFACSTLLNSPDELTQHHATREQAAALIALGDLRELNNRHYIAARGDTTAATNHGSVGAFVEYGRTSGAIWLYLYSVGFGGWTFKAAAGDNSFAALSPAAALVADATAPLLHASPTSRPRLHGAAAAAPCAVGDKATRHNHTRAAIASLRAALTEH